MNIEIMKAAFDNRGLKRLNEVTIRSKKINCIDKNGYKYFLCYNQLERMKKPMPEIVSKSNPHTIANIKNYLFINNIDCELVQEEYNGNKSKMKFKCSCGTIFETSWVKLIGENKVCCNKCVKELMRVKFLKDFEEVKKNYLDKNLKLLSTKDEYKNNKSKLSFMDENGYRYYMIYVDFVRNKTYQIVSPSNIYSIENIKRYLQINNIKAELLSTRYIKSSSPLKFKCECGNVFEITWSTINGNKRVECPTCSQRYVGRCNAKNHEFIENLFNKHGYVILDGKYLTGETKFKCADDDGYLYSLSYDSFKGTYSSYAFSKNNPYTIDNIHRYIEINDINTVLLSKEYNKVSDKLLFRCKCGREFYRSLDSFKNGKQELCRVCSKTTSSYERMVAKLLNSLNIDYETEYCVKIGGARCPHRFDFKINLNGRTLFIEADGEGHYKPIFNGEEGLQKTIERDRIKNIYCTRMNIPLLRIPYYDFFTEKYIKDIKDFIKKYD